MIYKYYKKIILLFVLCFSFCFTLNVHAQNSIPLLDLSDEGIAKARMTEQELAEIFVTAETVSGNGTQIHAETASYATVADAADYLREKMVQRKSRVTIRISNVKDPENKEIKKILTQAMAYDVGGAPDEGDYLYWHMQRYQWGTQMQTDGSMTMYFRLYYRTTASEEEYVTGRVEQIIEELNLRSETLNDYEKVRLIYDYVMSCITYDHVHYNLDQGYNYMYTAYAALKDGSAVCQAYATLFYRLCEEVGIRARVICGNDNELGAPTHGWNIVKIGSVYYNLDATWDDADVPTYVYFLKNDAEFTGHTRNARHATGAFHLAHPMAQESYLLPEENAAAQLLYVPNLSGSLKLTDDSSYSLTPDGKTKVLFFADPSDEDCMVMLDQFFKLGLGEAGLYDVAIVDIYNSYGTINVKKKPQQMMQEISSMAGNASCYKFSSDYVTGLAYRNQYAALVGKISKQDSCIVIVDAAGYVRYFGEGVSGVAQIPAVLQRIQSQQPYGVVASARAVQEKNNEVKLSWEAYPGADVYLVYRKTAKGTYYCVGSTGQTCYADEVVGGNSYTYCIYAMCGEIDIAKSDEITVSTRQILPKKGAVYEIGGCKFKIIRSTAKSKQVSFYRVTDKKLTVVTVPDTVMIDGLTYQVTEISSGALKGNKKVRTVSVGANVTKIGKKAFYNAKRLVNIVVKSKKIKSVGSKAFAGISGKAEIKVPSSKLKKYRKIFKGKGQKSSVKIRK